MQYAWNMARSLGHEAKQLISSADNEKYISLFYLNDVKCSVRGKCLFFRPWSKAAHIKREWLAATYGALRRQMQQAWYMAKYASILKPWSGTAHNKREGLEIYLVLQARMTSNLVL